MTPEDREGDFRGQIFEYSLFASDKSEAVMLNVKARLTGIWNETEWDDTWEEYDRFAEGSICLVKKDGSLNQNQAESLMKYAGWNGDFPSLDNGSWEPEKCAFVLKADHYEGQTEYRISFVNGYESTPGGSGLKPGLAEALNAKFGTSLRALAGNAKRSSNGNRGKGPAPPKAKSAGQHPADENADAVPF